MSGSGRTELDLNLRLDMPVKRKKLLIIDGYNVLRSGSRYSYIHTPDYTDDVFNTARENLMNDVINFAGADTEAIIVYDGEQSEHASETIEVIGGVKIIFSSKGQSADRVIEKLSHDARERGVETLVVTSDATIQDTVFGGGIDRMSAEGFCHELAAHVDAFEPEELKTETRKRTVADRVPADVARALAQLRDSL